DRRAPRPEPFALAFVARPAARLVHLPNVVAGLLVESDQKRPLAGAEVEEDEVLMQDRGRRVAPDVQALAKVAVPELAAVDAVAPDAGRAVRDEDALAVGGGGGGAGVVG